MEFTEALKAIGKNISAKQPKIHTNETLGPRCSYWNIQDSTNTPPQDEEYNNNAGPSYSLFGRTDRDEENGTGEKFHYLFGSFLKTQENAQKANDESMKKNIVTYAEEEEEEEENNNNENSMVRAIMQIILNREQEEIEDNNANNSIQAMYKALLNCEEDINVNNATELMENQNINSVQKNKVPKIKKKLKTKRYLKIKSSERSKKLSVKILTTIMEEDYECEEVLL